MSLGVGVSGSSAELDPPQTLADAHHLMARLRPRQGTPLTEWLAYHQQSAALYAEVTEIDRGHHHEALFMAERERQRVKEIKTQLPSQDQRVRSEVTE